MVARCRLLSLGCHHCRHLSRNCSGTKEREPEKPLSRGTRLLQRQNCSCCKISSSRQGKAIARSSFIEMLSPSPIPGVASSFDPEVQISYNQILAPGEHRSEVLVREGRVKKREQAYGVVENKQPVTCDSSEIEIS